MREFCQGVVQFFVSLKLTVALLALSIVLIFWATLAQVSLGIWGVQQEFFRVFVVVQKIPGTNISTAYPGGYLIGGLLLINLISAHIYRFQFSWRKAGIQMTHMGLILLLIGELLSGLWQEEFAMRLTQGETKNYSESQRDNELAIIDTTDAEFDDVVTIPEPLLGQGKPIQHPKLPFRVVTKLFYPNTTLNRRTPADENHPGAASTKETPSMATQGIGLRVDATPLPITYKQDERNVPSAYVELIGSDGSLGTWLVASHPAMTPQTLSHAGRSWTLALRPTRAYKPFDLTLLKFSHDRYAGTEIPKNFSSRVRLNAAGSHDDREVLIYMNNPLRYAGLTFYQSGYDGEKTTILQVVRNPSWLIPYVACGLMTFGLLFQFGIHLIGFVRKRRPARSLSVS